MILAAATAAAAVYAYAQRLPWVPDVARIRADEQRREQIRRSASIDLVRFQELIAAGAVVIDARPAEAFAAGHLDAPNTLVLNVHGEDAAEHLPRLSSLIGQQIVLYCTSLTCDLAEDAYIAMVDFGFPAEDLFIYLPGWEDGILKHRLPTTTGADTWSGGAAGLPATEGSADADEGIDGDEEPPADEP
jgi:rhodanese-related sulfurtransferase